MFVAETCWDLASGETVSCPVPGTDSRQLFIDWPAIRSGLCWSSCNGN